MTPKARDTLVHRLAMMLVKLNQGESLDPHILAEEFSVDVRTIQRDLNQRFAYLPLTKSDGRYRLEAAFLGKLSTRDVERFAALTGVRGLFPSLSNQFLQDIFDSRMQSAVLVKGHQYETLAGKEAMFRDIERAIVSRNRLSLRYGGAGKSHHGLEPYKLLNVNGIWYLAACAAGKVKTFSFSRIESLLVLESRFAPHPEVEVRLETEDGVWISERRIEVILIVSERVAGYFMRRRVLPNQSIVKTLDGGALLLSSTVGHVNEILPKVRYWIPHVRVISPVELQRDLEAELSAYLKPAVPTEASNVANP